MKKNYTCPVCGYDKIENPIYDKDGYGTYEICVCCGFEFGCDDYPKKEEAFIKWRNNWIIDGCQWFSQSTTKPKVWDPKRQLENLKQLKNKNKTC